MTDQCSDVLAAVTPSDARALLAVYETAEQAAQAIRCALAALDLAVTPSIGRDGSACLIVVGIGNRPEVLVTLPINAIHEYLQQRLNGNSRRERNAAWTFATRVGMAFRRLVRAASSTSAPSIGSTTRPARYSKRPAADWRDQTNTGALIELPEHFGDDPWPPRDGRLAVIRN